MNPYKVLGVSEKATNEEIRAAYLELVKKYHPDRYSDNPLKELAGEKLKEINEAYDMLSKNKSSSSGDGQSRAYDGFSGGGSAYSGAQASEFAKARTFINQNNLIAAKMLLDNIQLRNAEWYYLYGIIYLRQGWYDKASEYITRAYEQEPGNTEYRNAYSALRNSSNTYRQSPYGSGGGDACSPCNICSSLLCADCCCECMGGDLIRCC